MTFQMQSWRSRDEAWVPMEEGVAPKVWAPRPTREAAAHKCIKWTGLICIPAMRVIDLSTGAVVWQDTTRYPNAGELLIPEWTRVLYEQVRAEYRREYEASLCECGAPYGSVACRKNHPDSVGLVPRLTAADAVVQEGLALFDLAAGISC